jgi:Ca2+:H+ antiporter
MPTQLNDPVRKGRREAPNIDLAHGAARAPGPPARQHPADTLDTPDTGTAAPATADTAEHAPPPSAGTAVASLGLLVAALVGVVGLAKVESPSIGEAVAAGGLPGSFVGVVIALLVLLPETLAAVRNAAHDRVQVSFNLAFGSAMASIGLTIPAIAVASIWLDGPVVLGLGATQIVLLALTVSVGILTVVPGRAALLRGGVHLVVCAAFLFLAANP